MTPFARFLTCTVACALLSACVVVPRTQFAYDETCKVLRREMGLDVAEVGTVRSVCNRGGQECAAELVVLGAVVAASAVVSGSIVVIGNVVYWLERQGQQCVK